MLYVIGLKLALLQVPAFADMGGRVGGLRQPENTLGDPALNVRALRTLVAIYEHRSFREAAQQLGLTQSTVSMQMKALEEELNVSLFDRRQRPPTMTAIAQSIVQPAREIVTMERAIHQIASNDIQVGGNLRVGVIPTATISTLPAALRHLARHNPTVTVHVQSGLSDSLPLRVLSGEIDSAVVTLGETVERRLSATALYQEPMVIARPIDWDRPRDIADLSGVPFIRFNRRAGIGQNIERILRAHALEANDIMELDSVDAILTMVGAGLGVSIVPEYSVMAHHRSSVSLLEVDHESASRTVGFVTRAKDENAALNASLLEALQQSIPRQ